MNLESRKSQQFERLSTNFNVVGIIYQLVSNIQITAVEANYGIRSEIIHLRIGLFGDYQLF